MTGDLYLLNALWIGAALVIIGTLLPTLWRVVRFVIVMCLPFGLVAGWHVARDVVAATREHMAGDEPGQGDNVVPMKEPKRKR